MRNTPNMMTLVPPHGPHWAIEETAARQFLFMMRSTSVVQHTEDVRARSGEDDSDDDRDYSIRDGIAYLSLVGPMTKKPTSMDSGTSTSYLRRLVRAAQNDEDVKALMIRIDSPGGSVSGTADLAQDVRKCAIKKPVYAYIEDSACSAAYWVASQCTKIFSNDTALIGSIGTYMVLYDMSKAAEADGIEVLVLSTGDFKGAGVPGAAITEDQRTDFMRVVNDLNGHFLGAVAKGRSMTRGAVKELATGQVWIASDALSKGLIDRVCSMDEAAKEVLSGSVSNTRMMTTNEARSEHDLPEVATFTLVTEEPTVSSEDLPHGMTLAEESETVLAAVRGLTERVADIRAARSSEGRQLSTKALSHISDNLAQVEALKAELALLQEPSSVTRTELDKAIFDAQITLALSQRQTGASNESTHQSMSG